MIMLRGYKSVVFWLIFVSLWIIGCDPRCNDEDEDEIIKENENNKKNEEDETKENRDTNVNNVNNKNNIDDIINEIENKHTWTIFKIIITPGEGGQNINNLKIQNIVSKEYINNKNQQRK